MKRKCLLLKATMAADFIKVNPDHVLHCLLITAGRQKGCIFPKAYFPTKKSKSVFSVFSKLVFSKLVFSKRVFSKSEFSKNHFSDVTCYSSKMYFAYIKFGPTFGWEGVNWMTNLLSKVKTKNQTQTNYISSD